MPPTARAGQRGFSSSGLWGSLPEAAMSKAAQVPGRKMHPKSRGLGEVQAHLLLHGVGREGPKDLWEEGESCDETNSQDTWVPPRFCHKLAVGLSVSPSALEMQSLTLGLEVARDPAEHPGDGEQGPRQFPTPFPF